MHTTYVSRALYSQLKKEHSFKKLVSNSNNSFLFLPIHWFVYTVFWDTCRQKIIYCFTSSEVTTCQRLFDIVSASVLGLFVFLASLNIVESQYKFTKKPATMTRNVE